VAPLETKTWVFLLDRRSVRHSNCRKRHRNSSRYSPWATQPESGWESLIKAIGWDQVDLNEGFITLQNGETKNGDGRMVPILEGDMQDLLTGGEKGTGCEVA
jgi:hypothetical protein